MPTLFQQEPQWKRAGQDSITTVEWKARSDVIAAISKNIYAAISARGSMPILFQQEAQWKRPGQNSAYNSRMEDKD